MDSITLRESKLPENYIVILDIIRYRKCACIRGTSIRGPIREKSSQQDNNV